MNRPFRIGLMMENLDAPHWVYLMIRRLCESDSSTIQALILCSRETARGTRVSRFLRGQSNAVLRVFSALDSCLFNLHPDAFDHKDVGELLAKVPRMNTRFTGDGCSYWLRGEDVERIRSLDLDLLVRVFDWNLQGEILSAASFGVWSIVHGDYHSNGDAIAGAMEVIENRPITTTRLIANSGKTDGSAVLFCSYSSTNKYSITMNRNSLYWKSSSFLPRKLEQLFLLADLHSVKTSLESETNEALPESRGNNNGGNWQILGQVASHVLRSVSRKAKSLLFDEQWILLFSDGVSKPKSLSDFRQVIPPDGWTWADPFVVYRDNKHYVFFEEVPGGVRKGHISVVVVTNEGICDGPFKVLDRDYHLSYPFIFEWQGEYYMIPETAANRTIQLFKCVDFPRKWVPVMNLMEDITAYDATLLRYEGKWWLFASVQENDGASSTDELFVFHSTELLSNSWVPHPQNPVVSDARRARPAGKIYVQEGRIYRPSQICTTRYGYGISKNVITLLNTSEFAESEVSRIEPDRNSEIAAIHTINHAGRMFVADCVVKKSRFRRNRS